MSSSVVAFVANDAASDSVARTAQALAELLQCEAEAVHIGRVDTHTASMVQSSGLTLRVVHGDPAEQIIEEMSRPEVEAGVIGSRRAPDGARPAGHVALGAMARVGKLLAVVSPEARVPDAGRLRRVLMPLDGTESAARAVDHLAGRCARRGVEVVVLHVLARGKVPAFWDQPRHAAEAWGREFLARFQDQTEEDLRLRSGRPEDLILTVALEEGVDAVALGWSQVLGPGRALVVTRLLAAARIPILLVPVVVDCDRTSDDGPPVIHSGPG